MTSFIKAKLKKLEDLVQLQILQNILRIINQINLPKKNYYKIHDVIKYVRIYKKIHFDFERFKC